MKRHFSAVFWLIDHFFSSPARIIFLLDRNFPVQREYPALRH